MRFQMLEPWHVSNVHYEASVEVDGQDLPWPLPTMSVRALDQEALDALAVWTVEDLWSQLHYAPSLKLPNPRFPPRCASEKRHPH